jgi:hypothetical protein
MNYRVARVQGTNDCYGVYESPSELLAYEASPDAGAIMFTAHIGADANIRMTPAETTAVFELLSMTFRVLLDRHLPANIVGYATTARCCSILAGETVGPCQAPQQTFCGSGCGGEVDADHHAAGHIAHQLGDQAGRTCRSRQELKALLEARQQRWRRETG